MHTGNLYQIALQNMWLLLLKKFLMEIFIFYAVLGAFQAFLKKLFFKASEAYLGTCQTSMTELFYKNN